MMMYLRLLLLVIVFPALGTEYVSGQQIHQLPPFNVGTDPWQRNVFDGEIGSLWQEYKSGSYLSLAHQLEEIPGLTMQRRGFGSLEPNLRGFTMDRVTTTFNGHYLPIAAPTHTASPVNFLGPSTACRVDVTSGFPSVASGPVPVGGRIDVKTCLDTISRDKLVITGFSNPSGWTGSIVADPLKGVSPVDSVMTIYSSQAGHFESGENRALVDEKYSAWGLSFATGTHPADNASLNISANYHSQDEANNPSLPLDSNGSEMFIVTGEWIQESTNGEWVVSMGFADISHALSSVKRPVDPAASIALIEAQADAWSYSGRIGYTSFLAGDVSLRAGIDYISQNRDALRQRHLKSGSVLSDQIWPDISLDQAGTYVELFGDMATGMDWRIGARFEENRMDAGKVDAAVVGVPGAIGDTIMDNFTAFHGSDRSDIRKTKHTGSIQAVLRKNLNGNFSIVAGADYTIAPPGPGESYRAFLNALGGGLEIGNPMLSSEEKRSVSVAVQYVSNRIRLSSQAWHAGIHDFIQRGIVMADPLIYSFRNADCRFRGVDVALWFRPFTEHLLEPFTCELTFSRLSGKESVTNLSLPEIPPWESAVKFRWNEDSVKGRLSALLDVKHVAKKINPQPELNPLYQDTGSFLVVDAMMSVKLFKQGEFQIGISNLFDELCYAYLQPPVATGPVLPSAGNLQGGDSIPLPGRAFFGSLKWQF